MHKFKPSLVAVSEAFWPTNGHAEPLAAASVSLSLSFSHTHTADTGVSYNEVSLTSDINTFLFVFLKQYVIGSVGDYQACVMEEVEAVV